VLEALTGRVRDLGVAVRSVGLRDLILPGDMRALLNQVVAASKEAEANLIRRREETASTRSQANTARLLADNPALARLKELELLKDVLAGAKTTFVFGNENIAEQVRGLVTANDET
jgi:regulator of protease activity HflC (stomatin/prohibitin superfamily)